MAMPVEVARVVAAWLLADKELLRAELTCKTEAEQESVFAHRVLERHGWLRRWACTCRSANELLTYPMDMERDHTSEILDKFVANTRIWYTRVLRDYGMPVCAVDRGGWISLVWNDELHALNDDDKEAAWVLFRKLLLIDAWDGGRPLREKLDLFRDIIRCRLDVMDSEHCIAKTLFDLKYQAWEHFGDLLERRARR